VSGELLLQPVALKDLLTETLNLAVEFENGIQWRKNLRTTKASSTRNKAISHNSPLLSS